MDRRGSAVAGSNVGGKGATAMEQQPEQQDGRLARAARFEEQAFAYHKRQYRRENPPPPKPSRWVGVPWMMAPFALIAFAGSALSALRTAPVFIRIAGLTDGPEAAIAEGILAMIAVDLAVVAFRYVLVLLEYRGRESDAAITGRVKMGFWVAFTTQTIAQIYAVRGIAEMLNRFSGWLELGVALTAALSGMVLAFVTGEIMAVLWMRAQAAREQADLKYRQDTDEWLESMRRSWNRKKAALGIEASALRQRLSESVTDRAADRPDAISPSVTKALTWLRENPDATVLPVRTIADMAGVNRDAVSRARRMLTASATKNDNGTH